MEPSSSSGGTGGGVPLQDIAARRKQLKSQQSTVSSRRQQAVCVRRAFKAYGPKGNRNVILDGLNMTVPKGAIYGLLGASGCGKTTLLSCIVGRRRLDNGEIWVLGGKPGSRGSGVPGPRIGYMPQEIALYGEFSIRETLMYFGWICGMTTEAIDEKLDFLIKLLMLPSANRLVKNLSGGQQRRVSLSAALIHDPELLILDEPTVGVDPVLRQNIWDHLVHITKGGNKTIIITTHYIDETKQATIIGLMRGGYFLAEESPARLMQQWGAESLEDVFLKLSVIQNMGKRRRSSIAQVVTETVTVPSGVVNEAAVIEDDLGEISGEFGDNVSMSSRGAGRRVSISPDPDEVVDTPPELPPDDDVTTTCKDYLYFLNMTHIRTLIWKNFLWMWRNVPVMLFITLLPVAQIVLFSFSIGHDPKGLHISVKNYEVNTSSIGCPVYRGCNQTYMSCRYLSFLEKRNMIVDYFDTEEQAKNMVKIGKSWAAIVFQANYSDSFSNRVDLGRHAYDWDVEYSEISIYQDKSNQQISSLMWRDFNYAILDYIKEYLQNCGYADAVGTIPIKFNKPIYGDTVPNFTDFAAPGIILTIIFFLAVALTSGAMLLERNEGSLERSLVIGITAIELLVSHVITQFVVMAGQAAFVLIFSFACFGLTNNGNIGLVVILTLMTGLCGMCFGFVVASVCDTERTATYMALGSFLPIVMLCGVIWPIEGMYKMLQWVSFILPLTKSTESLRSILQRGWGIDTATVYAGFISTLIWITVFLMLSILSLKFKKG